MSALDWMDQAPCIDHPDPAVFTDALELRADRLRIRAALALCSRCPVVQRCLHRVQPQATGYDGIAAGHAWRNGHPIT